MHGEAYNRRRAVRHAMRVARADHSGRQRGAVSHITAERQATVRKDRALKRKARAHVRTGTVPAGRRSGKKGHSSASYRDSASRR